MTVNNDRGRLHDETGQRVRGPYLPKVTQGDRVSVIEHPERVALAIGKDRGTIFGVRVGATEPMPMSDGVEEVIYARADLLAEAVQDRDALARYLLWLMDGALGTPPITADEARTLANAGGQSATSPRNEETNG